tara:strand:+ start:978 stop:1487 length:510 start_codon:yes stop_codon:yes gene_type:complete
MEILDINNITCNNIFFKKINRNLSKPLYFGKDFIFSTPIMKCAFGLEEYKNNHYIKLQFDGNLENHSPFFDFIKKLEYFFKSYFKTNAIATQIRKYKNYDPLLVLKVPVKKMKSGGQHFNVDIEDDKLTTIHDIKKGMLLRCILSVNNVWHNDKLTSYKLTIKKIIITT